MKEIETLEFHFGGYPGPYHSLFLDYTADQIEVRYNCEGVQSFIVQEPIENERDNEFIMSVNTTKAFLTELAACHIDRWKEDYVEAGTLDGTSWRLTINYRNDKQLTKSGNNKFPTRWNQFLSVLQKYVNTGIG